MKRRKIAKIAVFVSNDDYGQVSEKILDDGAKAAGIAVADTERFNPASPNVDSEVTRAKGNGVQAFIVFSQDPGSALVAKAMVNQGVTLPAYADSPAVNEGFLRAAGASSSRWVIVTTNIDVADLVPKNDPSYKPIQTLMSLYPKGGQKPNHFSGTGADAYGVLIAALAKVGPDRAKIRETIETMRNFAGTTGTYNFSAQAHQGVGAEGLKLVSGAVVTGRGLSWKLVH
jgi:branched-chain amino acid transport system substrate-binding protein